MGSLVGAEVTLDEADLEPFEALASARGEVVEDADGVTVCQEPADQVMADESSASGDSACIFGLPMASGRACEFVVALCPGGPHSLQPVLPGDECRQHPEVARGGTLVEQAKS